MSSALPSEASAERIPSAAELFTLCGFAIALPTVELLARRPEFFVAHGLSASDIIGLATGLLCLPPLALWLLLWGLGRVSVEGATWAGRSTIAGLSALIVLAPLLRQRAIGELPALMLALCAGAGVAALYPRSKHLGPMLRFMSPAPVIVAVILLMGGDARRLLLPADTPTPASAAEVSGLPVVFLIFDELPLSSLQRADGQIDAELYPAFASLAADGVLFRGVSSVGSNTMIAMAPILSGRYPDPPSLPILADHPETLFTLLEGSHRMNVVESSTMLSPRTVAQRGSRSVSGLVSDVTLIYLHIVVPPFLRGGLPPINQNWGDFWADTQARRAPSRKAQAEARWRGERSIAAARLEPLDEFVLAMEQMARLQAPDTPALHFLHTMFPHLPWRRLPSGGYYEPNGLYGVAEYTWSVVPTWSEEPWWSIDAWRRHLLQVGYADRLLGLLLEKLQTVGLYDRAVIVVTSDHGATFWPGQRYRGPSGGSHPEDIFSVPLIIRSPGGPRGEVSDVAGETIDILPTIADLLDVSLPWSVDGCSLVDESCPARTERRVYAQTPEGPIDLLRFEPDAVFRRDTLDRKVEIFGRGQEGLYLAGQGLALIGRRAEDLVLAEAPAGRIVLDPVLRSIYQGTRPELTPARFVGELLLDEHTGASARVAFAIDGEIRVVAPALPDDPMQARIIAMLPEEVIASVPHGLAAYLVVGSEASPGLRPLSIE